MMGATIQVSDMTSFVYADGALIPKEDARLVEVRKEKERRAFNKRKLNADEKWMNLPDEIREREFPMFLTISNYVLEKVSQYLMAKSEENKGSGYTTGVSKEFLYKDLAKDVLDSMVVERLISGKPWLATPPPKSYFHHWYDLVDEGEAVCIDVVFTTVAGQWKNSQQEPSRKIVRIDGEEWKILKIDEDTSEYLVQWQETDYIYTLSRMDAEDFARLLHPHQRKLVTKDGYAWKLTRLEKNDE